MIDLHVNITFATPFKDAEVAALNGRLTDISSKGSVSLEELQDLIPGFEHRKIKVVDWKRNLNTIILTLES
jgi:hypothetical protein